jgi:hypothetical protein
MKLRWRVVAITVLLVALAAVLAYRYARPLWHPLAVRVVGGHTVAQRVAAIDAGRRVEIEGLFASWPPSRLTIVAYKQERELELWEPGRRVALFPILAASGGPGPKLREGDRQVPEGVYPVENLNPDSAFHLSLRVGYPNAINRAQAAREGRTKLGGDIMIHGGASSIGCIAVGDPAVEVLFKAVAATGTGNCCILIAPQRLRQAMAEPAWLAEVYDGLYAAIAAATR